MHACMLNKIKHSPSLKYFLHGWGVPFKAIECDKENHMKQTLCADSMPLSLPTIQHFR